MRKFLTGVMFLFVYMCVCSIAYCADEETVWIVDFLNDYESNQIRASKTWKGKTIRLTGWALKIKQEKDWRDHSVNVVILGSLERSHISTWVKCYVSDDTLVDLIETGMMTTIQGYVNDVSSYSPSAYKLTNCKILDIWEWPLRSEDDSNDEEIALYKEDAEQGDAEAQFMLGSTYDSYGISTRDQKDWKKAAKWYSKASAQGHSKAQYRLAMLYFGGQGLPQSNKKAMELMFEAANQGLNWAQSFLGDSYLQGLHGLNEDHKKAAEWYRKACTNHGGEKYKQAEGFYKKNDYSRAAEFFKQAAESEIKAVYE